MKTKETYVLRDSEWVQIEFKELKEGDVFKLYARGVRMSSNGCDVFVATVDAYQDEEGFWNIRFDLKDVV